MIWTILLLSLIWGYNFIVMKVAIENAGTDLIFHRSPAWISLHRALLFLSMKCENEPSPRFKVCLIGFPACPSIRQPILQPLILS